jgi:hypothetical protein
MSDMVIIIMADILPLYSPSLRAAPCAVSSQEARP